MKPSPADGFNLAIRLYNPQPAALARATSTLGCVLRNSALFCSPTGSRTVAKWCCETTPASRRRKAVGVGHILTRDAQLDDLADLTEVFRTASLSNDGDRENLLAHPEFLELSDAAIVEGRLRLAEIDGVAVGFVTGVRVDREVELEDLFVAPAWMRKGVATRLVADLIERSRAEGASHLVVTANPHAKAFYLSAGFHGSEEVETDFGPGARMYLYL